MAEVIGLGFMRAYKLTQADAEQIDKRRSEAYRARQTRQRWGNVVHTGSRVEEGDLFIAIVTKVVGEDLDGNTIINGQVILDGNDSLWVTNVTYGPAPGQWSNPA